jgi:hypothetical protein
MTTQTTDHDPHKVLNMTTNKAQRAVLKAVAEQDASYGRPFPRGWFMVFSPAYDSARQLAELGFLDESTLRDIGEEAAVNHWGNQPVFRISPYGQLTLS